MADRNLREFGDMKQENIDIEWIHIQMERDFEMNQAINNCIRILDTKIQQCVDKFKARIASHLQAKFRERELEARNSFYLIEQTNNELNGIIQEVEFEDRDPTSEESNVINTLNQQLEREKRKYQQTTPKICFYIDREELMATLIKNKLIEVEENNQTLS